MRIQTILLHISNYSQKDIIQFTNFVKQTKQLSNGHEQQTTTNKQT